MMALFFVTLFYYECLNLASEIIPNILSEVKEFSDSYSSLVYAYLKYSLGLILTVFKFLN